MHWGVRKSTPTNANYSVGQRQYDKKNYGHRGVKRINRRMNKGASLEVARKQEGARRRTVRTVATLGVLFAPEIAKGAQAANHALKMSSGVLAQHIAVKAETKRGQAAAAATMGLPSKPTNGPTFAKKSRGGVHKITTI
jgi:hypothetical protein